MSLEKTQHLKTIPRDDLKSVYKAWPNPLTPLALMLGGLFVMIYTLLQQSKGEGNFASLVGGGVVFIVLTLGSSIVGLIRVSKAKKKLFALADTHSLPRKEVLQEFRKNLKHIKSL